MSGQGSRRVASRTCVPMPPLLRPCCRPPTGDPQQLGPVVLSKHASSMGLQTSMLERLTADSQGPYTRTPQPQQGQGQGPPAITDAHNPVYITKLLRVSPVSGGGIRCGQTRGQLVPYTSERKVCRCVGSAGLGYTFSFLPENRGRVWTALRHACVVSCRGLSQTDHVTPLSPRCAACVCETEEAAPCQTCTSHRMPLYTVGPFMKGCLCMSVDSCSAAWVFMFEVATED